MKTIEINKKEEFLHLKEKSWIYEQKILYNVDTTFLKMGSIFYLWSFIFQYVNYYVNPKIQKIKTFFNFNKINK